MIERRAMNVCRTIKWNEKGDMRKMRAIVMLCMLLTAASAWAGTLVDDFSDGDFEGWTQSGAGNWRVENEELIFENRSSPSYLFMGEPDWEDYTISVNAKFVKHWATNCCLEAMFLVARGKSILTCYNFLMGTWQLADKKVAAFCSRGNWDIHNLRSKEFSWDMDTWYHLKLTADGDEFQFYVDDELVLDYEDSTFDTGKVGFGGAFNSTTIHFDDVVITGDNVPGMDMNLFVEDMDFSVEPTAKYTTTWAAIKYQ
jgi:3-keto-disaccharide hydrolase